MKITAVTNWSRGLEEGHMDLADGGTENNLHLCSDLSPATLITYTLP